MNTRANIVDEELCKIFLKLKVVSTAIGFESGNEEMLKYLVPCAQRIIVTKAKIDRSLETAVLKSAVKKIIDKKTSSFFFTYAPVTLRPSRRRLEMRILKR